MNANMEPQESPIFTWYPMKAGVLDFLQAT